MSMDHILIVEDDHDIANLLNIYFSGQGFQVTLASTGGDALALTRQSLPHLVVLDIMLPDIDGFEVCRKLRASIRTRHIPILFLSQRDARSDKIAGLELGADDYITKPFDIEELRLRIQNMIARLRRESRTDRRSGLPTGKVVQEQLRMLLTKSDWALIEIVLEEFQAYREAYGFLAGDEVLRMAAMVITDSLNRFGDESDFAGHPGGNTFVIITEPHRSDQIVSGIREGIQENLPDHYSMSDWQSGRIERILKDSSVGASPVITLSVGILDGTERRFSDLDRLAESLLVARRGMAELSR